MQNNKEDELAALEDDDEQVKRSTLKLVRVKELRRKMQELLDRDEQEKRERRPSIVALEAKKRSELIKEWETLVDEIEQEKATSLAAPAPERLRRPSVLAIAKEKKSAQIINKLESIIESNYKSGWLSAGPPGNAANQLMPKPKIPHSKGMLSKRGPPSPRVQPMPAASEEPTESAALTAKSTEIEQAAPSVLTESTVPVKSAEPATPAKSTQVSTEAGSRESWIKVRASEGAEENRRASALLTRAHAENNETPAASKAESAPITPEEEQNETAESEPPSEASATTIEASPDAPGMVHATDESPATTSTDAEQVESTDSDMAVTKQDAKDDVPKCEDAIVVDEGPTPVTAPEPEASSEKPELQKNTSGSWGGIKASRTNRAKETSFQIGGRTVQPEGQAPVVETTPPERNDDAEPKELASVHQEDVMETQELEKSSHEAPVEVPAAANETTEAHEGVAISAPSEDPCEEAATTTSSHHEEPTQAQPLESEPPAEHVEVERAEAKEYKQLIPTLVPEVMIVDHGMAPTPTLVTVTVTDPESGEERKVQVRGRPALSISIVPADEDTNQLFPEKKIRSRTVVATSSLFEESPISDRERAEGMEEATEEIQTQSDDEQAPASEKEQEQEQEQENAESSVPLPVAEPAETEAAPEQASAKHPTETPCDSSVPGAAPTVPSEPAAPSTQAGAEMPASAPPAATKEAEAAAANVAPEAAPDPRPQSSPPSRPKSLLSRSSSQELKSSQERAGAPKLTRKTSKLKSEKAPSKGPVPVIDIDEEFSSDEEREEEGKTVIVKCRSKSINRTDVDPPATKEGWLTKGKEARFPHWKKRWFVLEYPFLKYYTGNNEKQLKGHISLRGGCMVDTFTHTIKNVKHPDCTFRINGGTKMFLLEAASPQEKKEWVAALWSNIFYANPSKRHGGVSYSVELQLGLGEGDRACTLIVEMSGLRLMDASTHAELWKRPIHHVKSITRPDDETERWIIFNFDRYGGSVMLNLPSTTPTVIFNSVQSVILTHVAWRGNPILKGSY